MIRFTSRAAGDVQMFDRHALQLLAIIGKAAETRGVITPEQLPGAIAALEAAKYEEQQQLSESAARPEDTVGKDDDPVEPPEPVVGLAQRAFPLLEMLKRAQAAAQPVLWGV